MLKNNLFTLSGIACALLLFFKICSTAIFVPQKQLLGVSLAGPSPHVSYSPTPCETIKVYSESNDDSIEVAKSLKINVEIRNCLDTTLKLSLDPNVGKKNNHNACFNIQIKKYKKNKWIDIDESNNDLDFFNIKGYILLKPDEVYHYQLSPFKYLYPTPEKGLYQIIVYFYDQSNNGRYKSNPIEINVI